jgi:hypothetical protein
MDYSRQATLVLRAERSAGRILSHPDSGIDLLLFKNNLIKIDSAPPDC